MPIMVNVVIKTATEVTDAPFSSRDAAKGNEIKDGMCKIAPSEAMKSTPKKLDFSPIIFEI